MSFQIGVAIGFLPQYKGEEGCVYLARKLEVGDLTKYLPDLEKVWFEFCLPCKNVSYRVRISHTVTYVRKMMCSHGFAYVTFRAILRCKLIDSNNEKISGKMLTKPFRYGTLTAWNIQPPQLHRFGGS